MPITATTLVASFGVAAAVAGGGYAFSQATIDAGKQDAYAHNVTADLQHCAADILANRGLSDSSTTAVVTKCDVSPGTVITASTTPDGTVLVGTNPGMGSRTVTLDADGTIHIG